MNIGRVGCHASHVEVTHCAGDVARKPLYIFATGKLEVGELYLRRGSQIFTGLHLERNQIFARCEGGRRHTERDDTNQTFAFLHLGNEVVGSGIAQFYNLAVLLRFHIGKTLRQCDVHLEALAFDGAFVSHGHLSLFSGNNLYRRHGECLLSLGH